MMKNLRLKLFALAMGIILWSYVSLHASYTKNYFLKLKLQNLPAQIAIESSLPESLNVEIHGRGWDLLFFKPQQFSVDLPMNRAVLGDTTLHFSPEFLSKLELPRNLKITKLIGQKNYTISLEPRIERTLNIHIDGEFSPDDEFLFVLKPQAIPSEIIVTGARRELVKISEIATQNIDLKPLKKDTTIIVALQAPTPSVELSQDSIRIEFKVQKAAKKTFTKIPVQLIPSNQLDYFNLKPSSTKLTIVGGEQEIKQLNPEDFRIFIEFNRFQIEDVDSLQPSVRFPNSVTSYTIEPQFFKLDTLPQDSLLPKDSL